MKKIQIAAIGVIAALGLSTTAIAQQMSGSMQGMTPEQHRQMMSGSGQKGSGGMMMKHAEMKDMMAGCEKMMQMMGGNTMQMDKPGTPQQRR